VPCHRYKYTLRTTGSIGYNPTMHLSRKILGTSLYVLIPAMLVYMLLIAPYSMQVSRSIIKSAYSGRNYTVWERQDGLLYCTASKDLMRAELVKFKAYADQPVSILYLENVDVFDCRDRVEEISRTLRAYNISLALNLRKSLLYQKYFDENLASIDIRAFEKDVEIVKSASTWLPYLVVDRASDLLSFEERRLMQISLRKYFPQTSIGFRFENRYQGMVHEETHPVRKHLRIKDVLPEDDDGDFMITDYPVYGITRTLYIKEGEFTVPGSDGEFLE